MAALGLAQGADLLLHFLISSHFFN